MHELGLPRCSECQGVLVMITQADESGRGAAECAACLRKCTVVHFSSTAHVEVHSNGGAHDASADDPDDLL